MDSIAQPRSRRVGKATASLSFKPSHCRLCLLFLATTVQLLSGCGATGSILPGSGASHLPSSVAVPGTAGPLVITKGGVYSGIWNSNDPNVPAVQIQTSDPVTLRNSTLTGRGDLIAIVPTTAGANVVIENVTGTALDPGVASVQRGSFLTAQSVAGLTVHHCTMIGARFGVKVLSSQPRLLSITENLAEDLEDRESDGNGGFLPDRPDLGHFIMLNGVSATQGAEIAWNQFTATIGKSSTEDVINIYKSQGSRNNVISVHDNFMEGNASPSAPNNYTGTGLIADGDAAAPETAFVSFAQNHVVHTAGSGVEIAAGHDILVTGNRVVSCGQDAAGNWFAAPFVNAIVVWNFYEVAQFSNLTVEKTAGGMLRPDSNGAPMIADLWARQEDLNNTDVLGTNSFTDPCLQGGTVNLGPEDAERAFWRNKLLQQNIQVGDQHVAQ